jgi:hypothetical protein
VLLREHRRCSVPGCNNHRFLDLHHIKPRAEGGPNTTENIVVLCGAHHRAVHRGQLLLEGSGATHLRYRHADGSLYGQPSNPRALDAYAKVFSALGNLGFREREVRCVLDALRQDPAFGRARTRCVAARGTAAADTAAGDTAERPIEGAPGLSPQATKRVGLAPGEC